jgi:hypothetical protein
MMGVALDEQAWQLADPPVRELLAPVELTAPRKGGRSGYAEGVVTWVKVDPLLPCIC